MRVGSCLAAAGSSSVVDSQEEGVVEEANYHIVVDFVR
jgi:hypothetical protein